VSQHAVPYRFRFAGIYFMNLEILEEGLGTHWWYVYVEFVGAAQP